MKNERRIHNFNIANISANVVQYSLVGLTIIFALLYVWQINISATHGYAIKDLENIIQESTHQNKRLQYEVSRLQSVDSVTNRVQMLGLVKLDDVDYIKVNTDSSVAMR